MSAVITSMLNQLTEEEKEETINYIQYILSKRKKKSLHDGYKIFIELREEAKNNGVAGMTLEEINEEISKYRMEIRQKNIVS